MGGSRIAHTPCLKGEEIYTIGGLYLPLGPIELQQRRLFIHYRHRAKGVVTSYVSDNICKSLPQMRLRPVPNVIISNHIMVGILDELKTEIICY